MKNVLAHSSIIVAWSSIAFGLVFLSVKRRDRERSKNKNMWFLESAI